MVIEVFDKDFSASPIRATASVTACSDQACKNPTVVRIGNPRWDEVAQDRWLLPLEMVNVDENHTVYLTPTPTGGVNGLAKVIQCNDPSNFCRVELPVPKANFDLLQDTMYLNVREVVLANGKTAISGLRSSLLPRIIGINDAQTSFYGQNLVFNKISVGNPGKEFDLQCSVPWNCTVVNADEFAKTTGYLYFKAGSHYIPFRRWSDENTLELVPRHVATAAATKPANPPESMKFLDLQQFKLPVLKPRIVPMN